MTVDERLRQITLKIERAEKHIIDLEQNVRAFLATEPYRVASKRDPQTRKPIYYVARADAVPDCIPLIAGDAIQNLMGALDHLAYQLVCSDTRDNPPNAKWIYFPIADEAAKYEAKKRGKVQGASQDTIDAIDGIKPYKGGNDLLWAMYGLNNIEKHRVLLTVGSQTTGMHLGQFISNRMREAGHPFAESTARVFESMDMSLIPSDRGFPLKEGFELYVGMADEELNPNQEFGFEVALNEPGIVEGKPLLETVHQFANLVEGIVTALKPRLR
jgi:hypothetical protein